MMLHLTDIPAYKNAIQTLLMGSKNASYTTIGIHGKEHMEIAAFFSNSQNISIGYRNI